MPIPLSTTYNHILGQVITYHRRQLSYNQREFSERLEMAQPSISHIEGGDQKITVDFLRSAALALAKHSWELLLDADYVEGWLERRSVEISDFKSLSQDELMKQVALVLKRAPVPALRSRSSRHRK